MEVYPSFEVDLFPLEKHQIDGSEFKDTGNQLAIDTGNGTEGFWELEFLSESPFCLQR